MKRPRRYELMNCDRCGFEFKKKKLVKQKGLYVCPTCYDDVKDNKSIDMKVGSYRANATTTTPVNDHTTYTITAVAGITAYNSIDSAKTRSVSLNVGKQIYFSNNYYMKVVGSGAVDITADPQITAGSQGDILTIEGTSDTNTIRLDNGTGVELSTSFYIIKNGSIITLVYDTTKSKWVEVSRN